MTLRRVGADCVVAAIGCLLAARDAGAVVNGTRDNASLVMFPATGMLDVNTGLTSSEGDSVRSVCTATALSCGVVITAGHCVKSNLDGAPWTAYLQDTRMSTDSGAGECNPSGDGINWSFDSVALHPLFDELNTTSPQSIAHDVALLRVKVTNSAPWKHAAAALGYPKLGAWGAVSGGQPLVLVGYGFGLMDPELGLCMVDNDESCPAPDNWHSGTINKHRRYADVVLNQIVGADHWLLIGAENNGTLGVEGDSGGPFFLGDRRTLVGIQSASDLTGKTMCNPSENDAANVTALRTWIDENVAVLTIDSDHDGTPDACDMCPGPNLPDKIGNGVHCAGCADGVVDEDGDYVCDDVDNCLGFNSTDQSNLNSDYEKAHSDKSFGDACDLTPVAKPIASSTTMAFGPQSGLCGPYSPDPNPDPSSCAARVYTFNMRLWTAKHDPGPGFDAAINASTGFRYCVCRNEDGTPIADKQKCRDLHGCALQNNEYSKKTWPTTSWWTMSMHDGTATFDTNGVNFPWVLWGEDGENVSYNPGAAFAPHAPSNSNPVHGKASWDWNTDATAWKGKGWLPDLASPPPGDFPPGADIAGLLWTHNDSLEGMSKQYGRTCSGVDDDCGFGNNYKLWNPSRRTYACPLPPDAYLDLDQAFPSSQSASASPTPEQRWFPEKTYTLSIPLVSEPGPQSVLSLEKLSIGDEVVDPGMAIPCGSGGDEIAQLSANAGVATVISGLFTPETRQLLRQRPDLLWLEPSEPQDLVGSGIHPLSLAIDRATGVTSEAIVASIDGSFTLDPTHRTSPSAVTELSSTLPFAALGPSAYSRLTGVVVQLTGTTSGAPLDTVRVQSLFGETSEKTISPAQNRPMTALAVTYTYWDRRIWMVGTGATPGNHLFLYSIQIDTGVVEQHRRIIPGLSRFWLTTSANSEVVLVAAPKNGPWYAVAVIERQVDPPNHQAALRLAGVNLKVGKVIGPPHVSSNVLLIPAQDALAKPKNKLNPGGIHVDALPLPALRDGVHGQCFQPGN